MRTILNACQNEICGIVAYTYPNVCEKNHQFLSSIKKDAHKRKLVPFCLTVYMDERTFILLYKSVVRPHVEFANSVWFPYMIGDLKEIQKIQKRAGDLITTTIIIIHKFCHPSGSLCYRGYKK